MSNTVSSTNMALPVPIVGVEVGPAWASDLNACLTLIDSHTHAAGYGALVTPSGLSISADLSFISNNATSLRTARFASQSAALALSTDVRCLYAVGNELYYNDGNGTVVPMTLNGAVTGSAGTITGLPSGTASASYSAGAGSFVFQSGTNKSAYIDCSSLIIRNFTVASFGCTLAAPAAMAGDITITLPTIPASTLPLSISNAGLISASQITGTQIANITITDSNIAAGTITGAKVANSTITGGKIASATITSANMGVGSVDTASGAIASSINLTGNPTAAGYKIATDKSGVNALFGTLAGNVTGPGAYSGFTVATLGNRAVITFSVNFAAAPVVVATPAASGFAPIYSIYAQGITGCQIEDISGVIYPLNFIAYGRVT